MKIAILRPRLTTFSSYWMKYCEEHQYEYKTFDPYDSEIVDKIRDYDIILFDHHQADYRDVLFAKQLLFSLEQAGKIVFPNFRTGWHFDDKLGQKYLFEALGVQAAKSWVFYDKKSAYEWIETTDFPKVFKLRGGAGSANVMLAHNAREAKSFVKIAFGRGFAQFRGCDYVRDRYKAYKAKKITLKALLRSCGRLIIPTEYTKMHAPEKGYAYFQEFIPNDGFDYRLEIANNKAIAMVRMCREGDFRASGGHDDRFDASLIPQDVVEFAFECYDKLEVQSVALDIVREKESGELYLIEISYSYGLDADEFEHGYWTRDGRHHQEPFNGVYWMIEDVINPLVHNKEVTE